MGVVQKRSSYGPADHKGLMQELMIYCQIQLVFDPAVLKSAHQIEYVPSKIEGFLSFINAPPAKYVFMHKLLYI